MANRPWDTKREALRSTLKDFRVKAGITQSELSERLGKPQSYVSKYEGGERRLDFVEVMEVIDALSVPPEHLFTAYKKSLTAISSSCL